MATRSVDINNDWVFGNSLLNYKIELDEVKQNIITSLKSWVGDCFFDLGAGVDWYNYLGSYGEEENLKNNIIEVVNNVEGVITVENYDAYLTDERKLVINLDISTIYGHLNINFENV